MTGSVLWSIPEKPHLCWSDHNKVGESRWGLGKIDDVIYGWPISSLQLISGSWSLLLVFCYGVYHLSNSTTPLPPSLAALHISTLTFKTWLIFSRSGLVYTVSEFYDSALRNETGFFSLSLLSSSLLYTTLDSGINIGLCLLIFGLFSRGYIPY